jgi:hypothetical protein
VAVIAVAAAAALIAVGAVALFAVRSTERHTIHGTFDLHDPDTYATARDGSSCSGEDGFSDIDDGANVQVENEKSTVIATGALSGGIVSGDDCVFTLEVDGVPRASFYRVSVTHRGEISYSRSEMQSRGWRVSLTLGH